MESVSDEVKVGEQDVMTVNIQKQQMPPAKPFRKEKHLYILEHATLNVSDTFTQKYLDLLLKYHEVISDNK